MANVEWVMKLYDLDGEPVTAANWIEGAGVSERIWHATDRKMTFPLNGLDQLDFTLYLDDPMAMDIEVLRRVVKVWRNVNDVENSKTWTQPADEPTFVGIVQATRKDGEANTMRITCVSPLWRLQFHFHILNHYLVYDIVWPEEEIQGGVGGNEDALEWDQSALMWRLIDLTNGAWINTGSHTQIYRPESGPPYWTKTVKEAPFPVPKGSYTWSLIFEELLQQAGGVDLHPQYFHEDGEEKLMYFRTAPRRGSSNTSTSFDYHTGDFNCTNMTDDVEIIPGKFANYVWAVGAGGPNVVYRVAENVNQEYGRTDVGIYMKRVDQDNIQSAESIGQTAEDLLQTTADSELALSSKPQRAINATVSPVTENGFYYQIDYELGDLVALNADKGALQITNYAQRIYIVELSMSDHNLETAKVTHADDFHGAYV